MKIPQEQITAQIQKIITDLEVYSNRLKKLDEEIIIMNQLKEDLSLINLWGNPEIEISFDNFMNPILLKSTVRLIIDIDPNEITK